MEEQSSRFVEALLYTDKPDTLVFNLVLVAVLRKADLGNSFAETRMGDIGLIENLGKILFNEYVVPFEISSILFLSAMVGAVVIGKKE